VTSELHGCTLSPLSDGTCQQLVNWASGNRAAPPATGDTAPGTGDLRWLLAHCDSGVVWGHRRSGSWMLSGQVFPAVSPPLSAAAVQELRMFGPHQELLLWRGENGLTGRQLREAATEPDDPTRPLDDSRVLLGTQVTGAPLHGFTVISDAGGSRQAVPLALGDHELGQNSWLRLELRHYLERCDDPDTDGVLRVAASRLIDITRQSLPHPAGGRP
jgi:CRISPR-associated protein (TIGR03984 family)